MASPDHKAGLAVVVPSTDNRSPPRAKVKQNAFGSPRKIIPQLNGLSPGRLSTGMSPPSSHRNGANAPLQMNGTTQANQQNGTSVHQPSSERPQRSEKARSLPTKARLLGVDEALKYSPFSSIIPFNPDIIPAPTVNFSSPQPIFRSLPEQRAARHPLDILNEELAKTRGQLVVAQRAKNDLKSLLSQDAITNFKFKAPAKLNATQGRFQAVNDGNGYFPSSRTVGAFGNMILNATDLSHRYPTPISPGKTSPKPRSRQGSLQQDKTSKSKTPTSPSPPLQASAGLKIKIESEQQTLPVTPSNHRILKHNEEAFSRNTALSANAARSSKTTLASPVPMVIIPPSSAEALHSDFVTYEEPTRKDSTEVSRKRKRNNESPLGTGILQTKDQRTASDETLRQLQDFIQDIFEAEDRSRSYDLGVISIVDPQYFDLASHEGREIITLAPSIHVKLDSALYRVITTDRFWDIPLEDLQRIQKLCEGALTSAESLDLPIESEWSADEFTSWVQRLDVMDLGLRSARTVLRTMIGGREEKVLYSEELLQSVLGVVKKVLDRCIVPVVEARSFGPTSGIFEAVSSQKKVILQLLHNTTKVMVLLVKLLAKVEMAEMIITGIEFFATPLLFVENSHTEKDSVLGIQKFESLRRIALDMIAIIFARYSDQRLFLFDEVLGSLQKLPVSRQHARQYRLGEGTNIQLVSALILRLVQTSASQSIPAKKESAKTKSSLTEDGARNERSSELEDRGSNRDDNESSGSEDNAEDSTNNNATQALSKDASSRLDNAAKSAQYVVRHLVQRAMTASKTGEEPHRQLLDIFVEDLIAVLSLPEWPAAELLLRILLASFRNIAENGKSTAPAKNMALELLGMMGSAISELVLSTQQRAKSLESSDAEFSGHMRQMIDDYMDGSLELSEVIIWNGPCHAVVEYLESNSSDDPQADSAQGYFLARWAKAVTSRDLKPGSESDKLAIRLRKMLSGTGWYASNSLDLLSIVQYRVAYALSLLSMDFCRQFDYILKILLDSVTSEQITVRTRSLKSVTQMLERDPSILDRARNVKILIIRCATDASSMVRDSALTLIGKCIVLKPALEGDFLGHVLRLTDDPATGVRKRSMKLLKDIYLRNKDRSVKTAIGDSLLHRANDHDIGVSDLARQTFEDIWLSPFWTVPELNDASAQDKVALKGQTSLIVATARRGEKVSSVLVHLLREVLSNKAKNAAANFKVCKSLVATAFDMIIDNIEETERINQRHILQTMTVFAKANPKLFASDQLEALRPYIANLSSKEDLDVFRSTVVIFRCVLPVLSNVQLNLLRDIQQALIQIISKLGKAELNEVAECLWTINSTLQNPEKLSRLIISVLNNLRKLQDLTFGEPNKLEDLKRVKKYLMIAGYFGKHCDFEGQIDTFKGFLPWWKGSSVAELIVEAIHSFTASRQPLSLRAEALDSIGLVCQTWPYQYTQTHISNAFQDILRGGEPELQSIVLSSFREFFATIDRKAQEKGGEVLPGTGGPAENKLGGSMKANDGDGASALIAQRFLKDILAIALASQDASALAATEVIASINRQGLVHPKESGPALVALGTSTNPAIADVAFQEHRLLHQQHESMFEREYMRAIQEAFRYQKEIVKDPLGYTMQPYASKLIGMFDIIKTSKGKYQKKFLSNFCARIDFDISKMDLEGNPPHSLQFSRFLIESLAFFEYGRLDELMHTISCTEKIVADTGSGIAHSISTEVFHLTIDSITQDTKDGVSQIQSSVEASQPITIDSSRLRQLTIAAIILSSLWEVRTYLKRLYGLSLNQQKKEGKVKTAAKDLSKVPSRVQGVSGDKIAAVIAEKMNALETEESMNQQCRAFVDLMSIDNEVKVATEGDEDVERPETPSEDEERDTPMSGGSRRIKRKASDSIAGTPMKKKRGRPSSKRKQSAKSVESDEEWD